MKIPIIISKKLCFSQLIYITANVLFVLFTNTKIYSQTSSNGLPEGVIPAGVGVNTHFITGGTVDHDMIANAGFKVIRQDFFWYLIETEKGVYNWSPYDTLIEELDQRGIRGLITLNLNNTFYAPTTRTAPTDSANIEAYARFAAAAAERYKSSHCIWEFWNEPNGKNTWKPGENAAQYAKLALSASKAIRAVDSGATIIAPAMAGIHLDYLDTLFSSGLLNYIDGVSVHPYRDGPPPKIPETVGSQIRDIQNLIAKYAPPGKKISVISGEWGYSTCNTTKGVSLQTQADYFVRMQLYNLFLGIPLTIWYDWKNDGTDITQLGQNRGVVTADLALKPSYVAVMTLTHELAGYEISTNYYTGNPLDIVLILRNQNGGVKIAAWTQGTPHNVSFQLQDLSFPDTLKKVWWMGVDSDTGTVKVDNNKFTVEINDSPKYYSLVPPVRLPVAAPPVPELILPSNNSKNLLRKTAFQWNAYVSNFSTKYQLQIATDSIINPGGSFLSQNIVFDTTLADTSLLLSNPLDSNKVFYWHVRSINIGGESDYSPIFNFKTSDVIAIPFIPTPISPAAYVTGVQRKARFEWRSARYAESYELQVSTDYHIYSSGDSIGAFKPDGIVLDTILTDTTCQVSEPLDSLTKYFWHIRALNSVGVGDYFNNPLFFFTTGTEITGIENESSGIPNKYFLYQNFPNPFNPETTIKYTIASPNYNNSESLQHVVIKVYDLLGQEISTLVNEEKLPGNYKIKFGGRKYTSGIYFVRMRSGNYLHTIKMLLLK